MSKDLTVRQSNLPANSFLGKQLGHQVQQMEALAEITKEGISAIGDINEYAYFKTVATMNTAELLKHAAALRGMSSTEQAAYDLHTQAYLQQISVISQAAGIKIIELIQNMPLDDWQKRGFLDRLGYLLTGE